MSKYTTEVRFIVENVCGLTESEGYDSVNQLIDTACPLIFNFDFPIFDEAYRPVIERKILKHYYTREIGMETVGLWKLQLDRKLNEIMPYYNKMYESELIKINPLYNYSLSKNTLRTTKENSNNNYNTSEINKNSSNGTVTGSANENINGSATNIETTNNSNNSSEISKENGINKFSDTPQGGLNGVINNNYLTNATATENVNSNVQNSDTNTNRNNINSNENNVKRNTVESNAQENNSNRNTMGTNVQENNSTEGYIDEVVGHTGTSESNLILEYRKTFLNIDMMIIDELADLFMNLW